MTCLATHPGAADTTDLEDRITALRKTAEFDSTLVLAKLLHSGLRADSAATRHEVADANRLASFREALCIDRN